jgi:CBS domain containing-hemolysin-like protein
LAEFAIVKVRPSRVAQLSAEGDARARLLATIQEQLDEYLSVCQVGITLASVALGMVGERTAEIIMGESHNAFRHVIAITVSYLVISGSHILLGELVPKSIAIRLADRMALLCARPLRVLHSVFFPALWLLTKGSNAILRLLRMQRASEGEQPSEQELRIILDQSQERGVMSFRRLLFMENIFDLGSLQVRDAMRRKARVRTLDARLPWAENLRAIQESRFSRFPLLTDDPKGPSSFVHIKDLLIQSASANPDLAALARPLLATTEITPLETLFAEMQRRRVQMALVADGHGAWTGIITLEDILEELVGTIHDEFDKQEPLRVSESLTVDHIQLGIEASSTVAAVREAIDRMPKGSVPLPVVRILRTRSGRERLVGTYLGDGIGMPHARLLGLDKPFLMILRSTRGVPCDGTS